MYTRKLTLKSEMSTPPLSAPAPAPAPDAAPAPSRAPALFPLDRACGSVCASRACVFREVLVCFKLPALAALRRDASKPSGWTVVQDAAAAPHWIDHAPLATISEFTAVTASRRLRMQTADVLQAHLARAPATAAASCLQATLGLESKENPLFAQCFLGALASRTPRSVCARIALTDSLAVASCCELRVQVAWCRSAQRLIVCPAGGAAYVTAMDSAVTDEWIRGIESGALPLPPKVAADTRLLGAGVRIFVLGASVDGTATRVCVDAAPMTCAEWDACEAAEGEEEEEEGE